MNTARVDICYRPLRIAWAILSSDRDAFRYAVKVSHTMWGGRFNPIILVDRPEAPDLVELFRADMIVPLGNAEPVTSFAARFPYLMQPYIPRALFLRDPRGSSAQTHVLDIHNALLHWRENPAWKELCEAGLRTFQWDADDPLSDVFLMHLGAYPTKEEIGIDYHGILSQAAQPHFVLDKKLDREAPIDLETLQYPSLPHLSRLGIDRHYSVRSGWQHPGFFVGDASSIDDLVRFWNLRAADITVYFIDPNHMDRYRDVRPEYARQLRENLADRREHDQKLAVWADQVRSEEAVKLFPGEGLIVCPLGAPVWQGGAVRPPMMILGEESALGVLGNEANQPQISFTFQNKPFFGGTWFHTQHLIASISLIGARDPHHTFQLPYVPELNEFFALAMYSQYDRLRVEPERIGIVIDAAGHAADIRAMPVGDLVEKIFDLSGLKATPSAAGLITRQLISRLGGVDGARAFKIPGVRRLIRTHGPRESFTRGAALQLIGGRDPDNPSANFADYADLYIEPRAHGTKLTADMVFAHLVAKDLFRIGSELTCPSCKLPSWIPLDQLRQRNVCDLCGTEYDATRQLVGSEYRYRRTGVLGLERNAQGAVPVALLLQQLSVNVQSLFHEGIYLPSFDLAPKPGTGLPACETDFVVILPRTYPHKAQVIIGECKDRGGSIDANDVDHMRRIADAFPKRRFDTYLLFTKLAPFSEDEITLAQTLNGPFQRRVILLTDRELEPYHLYERVAERLGRQAHARDVEDLAGITAELYFIAQPGGS